MPSRIIGALVVVSTLVGCSSGGSSDASQEEPAVSVTSLGALGFDYTQGCYVVGFVFRAKSAVTIGHLGYYDSNLHGKADTFGTHDVGVYDLSTHTLLVSTTVAASDPATGWFRYKALASPLALNTTDTYAVVGITGASYYTVGITATEAPVSGHLTYVSGAGYSTTQTSNDPTPTSALVEPNAFDAGNIFGTPTPGDVIANFGPNFTFAP